MQPFDRWNYGCCFCIKLVSVINMNENNGTFLMNSGSGKEYRCDQRPETISNSGPIKTKLRLLMMTESIKSE